MREAAMTADPTLPLLWRSTGDSTERATPRRGPKAKVSVDEVIDAGIEVADSEGLAALSMRGLAQRLGLGAMSLYTYVPGRDELVVLMVDQVFGRTVRPAHAQDVRRRLEQVAETSLAEYLAHPWLLELTGLRAFLGPHAAARYEWQLTAVDGLGLGDVEMDQTVVLLDGLAATAARSVHDVLAAERRSGLTELEWWEANAEALGEVMAGHSFPLAGRVGQAAGELYQAAQDPERQFRFGLARVVDGLLAYLE
jgi:AcrR family transcriptional regulator